MSDFLFVSVQKDPGVLSGALSRVGTHLTEYHGSWGSLATSMSHYRGFQPVETERHICVVVGGPVLYFASNSFLGLDDSQAGTRLILEHWQRGKVDWSEDLSGPFVILVIDKWTGVVDCITDMMMFIPVYQYCDKGGFALGTHIDAVARALGKDGDYDEASLVDFVLHNTITYPYTAYLNIRQCQPGSVHRWGSTSLTGSRESAEVQFYWRPVESTCYTRLREAAQYLREGVGGYIERITDPLDVVAQFISAGEDSRVVAGMLPESLERHAFTFLGGMNREGILAKRVAEAYGAYWKVGIRNDAHALDMLPEASELVGTGNQFAHAHTLGFHAKHGLSQYRAVFGGYMSDTLLKAPYANVKAWPRALSFLPRIPAKGETRTREVSNHLFSRHVLDEVTYRRREHYNRIEEMRPLSAHEWFDFWPASMRDTIPNLYCNRRLFASYEVFMAKESVKISAGVPLAWKLNRRLFSHAFKTVLRKSRFIIHADGYLPYYPWWTASTMQFVVKSLRKIPQFLGHRPSNQKSWENWGAIVVSPAWAEVVVTYSGVRYPSEIGQAVSSGALLNDSLSTYQRVNLLQVCHQVRADLDMDDSHGHHSDSYRY